jgi:hypothetical protein
MFKWFNRRATAPPVLKPPPSRPTTPSTDSANDPAHLDSLPEVVAEGNTQADWSAWEESMSALDSQMKELNPPRRVHVRDVGPVRPDDTVPQAARAGGKRSH